MWTVGDHTQLIADIKIALGHTGDQGHIVTSAQSAKRVPRGRHSDRKDRPMRDGAHDHTGDNAARLARLVRIQAMYRELMSISTATSRRSRGLRTSDEPSRVTDLIMRIRCEADAFVEATEKVAARL